MEIPQSKTKLGQGGRGIEKGPGVVKCHQGYTGEKTGKSRRQV